MLLQKSVEWYNMASWNSGGDSNLEFYISPAHDFSYFAHVTHLMWKKSGPDLNNMFASSEYFLKRFIDVVFFFKF